jgi:hypothetical protein
LFDKINFLMDATVIRININQNKQDHQDLRWPASLLPPTLITMAGPSSSCPSSIGKRVIRLRLV